MMQQDVGSQNSGTEVLNAANFHQSNVWHDVEHIYLHILADHDHCVACNLKGHGLLQVHHILPVEFCFALGREDLTVNPLNMITLCEGPGTNDHHIALGHLGDFHWYNPDVLKDVIGPWKDLPEAKIRAMLPDWPTKQASAIRLQMSDQQKNELNSFVLETFGPKPPGTMNDWVEHLRQQAHKGATVIDESTSSQN